MKKIKLSKLQKAIYLALSKTYVKALTEATPGDGETHMNWDVDFRGNKIFIVNSPTGDNITFTNDGTKAHEIHAKPGHFLRFKIDKNKHYNGPKHKIHNNMAFEKDGYVFAKAVYHPGIQKQMYIEKIMADKTLEKQCRLILEKEIEKLIK